MKKIFAFLAILPIATLLLVSVAAAQERKPVVASTEITEEVPLSCQVLFVFVRWGIKHPEQYIETADFNKDKIVNFVDFITFARNSRNSDWCAEQLGW